MFLVWIRFNLGLIYRSVVSDFLSKWANTEAQYCRNIRNLRGHIGISIRHSPRRRWIFEAVETESSKDPPQQIHTGSSHGKICFFITSLILQGINAAECPEANNSGQKHSNQTKNTLSPPLPNHVVSKNANKKEPSSVSAGMYVPPEPRWSLVRLSAPFDGFCWSPSPSLLQYFEMDGRWRCWVV